MTVKKPQNKSKEQLELESYMANFYGTEHYYRDQMLKYLFTDGVKAFAEKAGAYWFLQEMNRIVVEMKNDFMSITLKVKDGNADICVRGDDDKEVVAKHIPYTDCPDGDWIFYYNSADNIVCWCGEY